MDKNEIYPYNIEGLGKNLIPSATDFSVIDKFIKVTDKSSAYSSRLVTKKEGIFVGYTSGSVYQAIIQLNDESYFNNDSNVVLIFPDHGSRYMSKIYNDEWMINQGFFNKKEKNIVHQIEYV